MHHHPSRPRHFLPALAVLIAALAARAQPPVPPPALPLPPGVVKDCAECPELVTVPAGASVLGTSADAGEVDAASGESPPLAITIGRPFALGRFEVTLAEYRAFVNASAYQPEKGCRVWQNGAWVTQREKSWQNPGFTAPPEDRDPVVCVSWDDARAYVDWLSKKSGRHYRLPSEAEWEYAARGGTTTARYFGERDSGESDLVSSACEYANVYDLGAVAILAMPGPYARCNDHHATLAPVGSYRPNAFDLYDMIGNAREWVADCYTTSYLGRPADGRAWEWSGGCERRGVRGGSWASRPERARAAARSGEPEGLRQQDLGFRVARESD
jgi:formylglycine-generating enzyme required for sulfatase activity